MARQSVIVGRRGVVLVWALITMAVTTTILGAMGAYYVHVGRVANVYMAQTSARFEAQRKIESAKAVVVQAVKKVLEGIKSTPNANVAKENFRTLVGAELERSGLFQQKGKRDNADVYELKDDESLNVLLNDDGTIDIEATGTSSAGGITLSVSNSERLDFGIGKWQGIITKSDLVSHPIFNYVYFANNYGHLESKGIVANGDVGSNDKFTIDGATINGYVTAYSTNPRDADAVRLRNTTGQKPRMWTYQAYVDNIAKEYLSDGIDDFTPARPTNPYKTSAGKELTWKGGYEYPAVGGSGGSTPQRENATIRSFYNSVLNNQYWGKNNKKSNFRSAVKSLYNSSIKSLLNVTWERSELYLSSDNGFQYDSYRRTLDAWFSRYQYYSSTSGGGVGDTSSYVELKTDTKCTVGGITRNVINVSTNLLAMPNISNAQFYRNFCMSNIVTVTNINAEWSCVGQVGGSLSCPNRYNTVTTSGYGRYQYSITNENRYVWEYDDGIKLRRYLTSVNLTGGYDSSIMPFSSCEKYYDDWLFGGWRNFDASAVEDVERGSVILIGSEDYPIVIRGPVYFDGDVLIRGFVTGQGTIYAGRNIHVLGDITYLNPPHWPNAKSVVQPATALAITNNAIENAKCDLLMLAARGNIVFGDYTGGSRYSYYSSWYSTMSSWIRNTWSGENSDSSYYSESQGFDDTEIGYPGRFSTFRRALYLNTQSSHKDKVSIGYTGSGMGRSYCFKKSTDLCYYKTKLHDSVITMFIQSTGRQARRPRRWPPWFRDLQAEITHIDAVLFANHGIFGLVGGTSSTNSKKFTLNGALICRDEGLLYCLKSRISDANVWLNWDMRISSESAEGNSVVGVTPDSASSDYDMYFDMGSGQLKRIDSIQDPIHTTDWRQVK